MHQHIPEILIFIAGLIIPGYKLVSMLFSIGGIIKRLGDQMNRREVRITLKK